MVAAGDVPVVGSGLADQFGGGGIEFQSVGLLRAGQPAVIVEDLRQVDRRLNVARKGRSGRVVGVEAEADEGYRQDEEPESSGTGGVIATRGAQDGPPEHAWGFAAAEL